MIFCVFQWSFYFQEPEYFRTFANKSIKNECPIAMRSYLTVVCCPIQKIVLTISSKSHRQIRKQGFRCPLHFTIRVSHSRKIYSTRSESVPNIWQCGKFVYTHTHTHTHSHRASIYKLFLKYQSFTESPFPGKSLLCPFLSAHLYAAPAIRGHASLYPSAKYAGTWSVRVHILRRCVFFYTSIIIPTQI